MDSSERASQACRPCRRLKRKCTRELPSCSLCIRLNKTCAYPVRANRREQTPQDDSSLAQRVQQLETQLGEVSQPPIGVDLDLPLLEDLPMAPPYIPMSPPSGTSFPSSFFLDSESFASLPRSTPNFRSAIPPEVPVVLGSSEDVHALCGQYFSTVDMWFPIFSKKRMYLRLLCMDHTSSTEFSLLLLCMKLVTDAQHQGISHLYWTTKHYFFTVENSNIPSLPLLQAAILISLYEIGHAIYPAAYTSTSHAARLGMIMGLHDRQHAVQLYKPAETPFLREEERRTWWALVILDRYTHLGTTALPLSTPALCQTDILLPCSDQAWTAGSLSTNEPLFTTSFSPTSHLSPFASACQAAHLLTRVLSHRDDIAAAITASSPPDPEATSLRLSEAMQLHHTLEALTTHLIQTCSPLNPDTSTPQHNDIANTPLLALCLTAAARLLLYAQYACNETGAHSLSTARMPPAPRARVAEEAEMQRVALDGVRDVAGGCAVLVAERVCGLDGAVAGPLVGHALYLAASECAWLVREEGGGEMGECGLVALRALRAVAARWRVGGEYLELLRREDALMDE